MTAAATRIGAGIAKEVTMTDAASHDAPERNAATTGKIRVRDPLVRMFHWSLVAAVATAWLSADEV